MDYHKMDHPEVCRLLDLACLPVECPVACLVEACRAVWPEVPLERLVVCPRECLVVCPLERLVVCPRECLDQVP